jgi:hypothetical protein
VSFKCGQSDESSRQSKGDKGVAEFFFSDFGVAAGCDDEAHVLSRFEDTAATRLVFVARGVEPSGYASIDEAVSVVSVEVNLGVVSPALLAGSRSRATMRLKAVVR